MRVSQSEDAGCMWPLGCQLPIRGLESHPQNINICLHLHQLLFCKPGWTELCCKPKFPLQKKCDK